jgi:hypothetical protein
MNFWISKKKWILRPIGLDLKKIVDEKWYVKTGLDYWVSDNTVRKWLKIDGIPLEKIKKWVTKVICDQTGVTLKRDVNQVEKYHHHFKDRASADEWQKQNWKLASLTKEKYEEMKQTKSIRKIAEELGCNHRTLIKKFDK